MGRGLNRVVNRTAVTEACTWEPCKADTVSRQGIWPGEGVAFGTLKKKKNLDCSEARFADVPFVTQTHVPQPLVGTGAELCTEEADTSETCIYRCAWDKTLGPTFQKSPGCSRVLSPELSHPPAGTKSFSSKHWKLTQADISKKEVTRSSEGATEWRTEHSGWMLGGRGESEGAGAGQDWGLSVQSP